MSYSNNVKNLILTLVKQGHSPEETLKRLSQKTSGNREKSDSFFEELADSLSLPFTTMDCQEIYMNLPSSKTVRRWMSEESSTENQSVPTTELLEIEQSHLDQFNQEKIEAERIGILNAQGKYPEEWKHYNEIKEAIIKMQYASVEQIGELLDIIARERVNLDDSSLQKDLDEFIAAIHESMDLGLSVPYLLITPVISRTIRRMNKRYKRN